MSDDTDTLLKVRNNLAYFLGLDEEQEEYGSDFLDWIDEYGHFIWEALDTLRDYQMERIIKLPESRKYAERMVLVGKAFIEGE